MQPIVVMPMNDPSGLLFPQLKGITPLLKSIFAQAFVSVGVATQVAQPDPIGWLRSDPFFRVPLHDTDMLVGDDFLALYRFAVAACAPEQVVHLCYCDRVAFALQSVYREQFTADLRAIGPEQTPLIFQRSAAAWETHPTNYRNIEQFITTVGEHLFGRTLDYAWCHLALTIGDLRDILPHIHKRDLSFCAEMVILLQSNIRTKQVDWLAWEDPFTLSRDADQLKRERESSLQETRKRLCYAIPMLQVLYEAGMGQG